MRPQPRRLTMDISRAAKKSASSRRAFLSKGIAAGAATVGAGYLANSSSLFAEDEKSGRLTPGDAALLRFAAAAQILKTDFWVQYNEPGTGPHTSNHPPTNANPPPPPPLPPP